MPLCNMPHHDMIRRGIFLQQNSTPEHKRASSRNTAGRDLRRIFTNFTFGNGYVRTVAATLRKRHNTTI